LHPSANSRGGEFSANKKSVCPSELQSAKLSRPSIAGELFLTFILGVRTMKTPKLSAVELQIAVSEYLREGFKLPQIRFVLNKERGLSLTEEEVTAAGKPLLEEAEKERRQEAGRKASATRKARERAEQERIKREEQERTKEEQERIKALIAKRQADRAERAKQDAIKLLESQGMKVVTP
jgi:hypothetical protein